MTTQETRSLAQLVAGFKQQAKQASGSFELSEAVTALSVQVQQEYEELYEPFRAGVADCLDGFWPQKKDFSYEAGYQVGACVQKYSL